VAGVTVTITNTRTNQSRQATTNEVGAYDFLTVQAGTYEVRVAKAGFAGFSKTGVEVTINNISRVDAVLQVGGVTESVTVTAALAVLQTDRAEVRAEVTSKQLVDSPGTLNRNYQYLLNTIPGVTPIANEGASPSNATGGLRFNVNGTSNQINNTRIDGTSASNIWMPQYVAYTPPIEAIESVNVVTNSYDAEQGLAGGAAVNVQMKSGTNEYHGSLFEYHHNQHLRARSYFLPPTQGKGKYILNQFGGTLGGPIKRDKLFFFVNFENSPNRRNANQIVSVPTQAVRDGNMAGFPIIYDPTTGNADGSGRIPFSNNQVPPSMRNSIVQKIIPLIPAPNLGGDLRNYFASGSEVLDRWATDMKSNWNVTQSSTVWGRFSLMNFTTMNPTVFGEKLVGDPTDSGNNGGSGGSRVYNFSAGGVHTFTPNLVMDVNLGYVWHDTHVEQPSIGQNVGLDMLGLPGTNGPKRFQSGWPAFTFGGSGYSSYGVTEPYMPYYRWDRQLQLVGNFSWIHGSHEVRWGTDIYKQDLNHIQPEVAGARHGARGTFTFATGPVSLCAVPDGKGGCVTMSQDSPAHGFAEFLLGLPTRLGKNLMTVDEYTTRQWEYSFYVRDKWQIGRKLTISYGTRWEYFPIPTRADRGLERYDPLTNKMWIGGVGTVPRDLGVSVSRRMFAPRFGLAYRPTNTLVIRGGYGLTNDPYSMARPMRANYPVIIELDNTAPSSWLTAGQLADGIPTIVVPSLGNGIIDIPPKYSATTLPDKFRRGYIQSWNLTVQKELPLGFVAEAGYVATRQVRQFGFLNLNWAPIGTGTAGQQLYKPFGRSATTQVISPIGGSHYDSLQARLQRRFGAGFLMQTAYTWSKCITTSGPENSDGMPRIAIPEFYGLNRSVCNIDRTHNLRISYIAELPFGKGKRYLKEGILLPALLGGWQLNGLLSFYSGGPFSVTASGTSLNAPGSSQRADQVKANVQKLGGVGPGQPFFDPTAFVPVLDRRFGTAGFNSMRGPGMANWDCGLYRTFNVTERWKLQFRMDGLNITNTPHFGNPGGNASSAVRNADGSIRSLNGYGEVLSASDERQFRLGLRLNF
jgi:hypothetical protein